MPDHVVVIANPAARLVGDVVPVEELGGCLREAQLEFEVHVTAQAGDGERLAREAVSAGARRVVAAGGDGTINEVLQGLAGTETELAIVPLGTGNVIARSVGLAETDLRGACRVAAGECVKRVDLGLMGGRYFAATAGAGLDAAVALHLDPWWKQRVGKVAFLGEFLRSVLMEDPHVYRLQLDDQTVEGPMWGVLITNTNEYTWRIRPVPDPREDDGLLDVVVIHRQGYLDLIDLAARLFVTGESAAGHPTASVLRVGHMSIEAVPPVPWQVEGDPRGVTPVNVEVVPQALKLVTAKPSG
ncbi:diacylglycerol kinase family lipid kinase [bacterium]|nr:diacylglycerol kinase family lipid kinase [bacterium]